MLGYIGKREAGTDTVHELSNQFPKIRAISWTILETSLSTNSIIRNALHDDGAVSTHHHRVMNVGTIDEIPV